MWNCRSSYSNLMSITRSRVESRDSWDPTDANFNVAKPIWRASAPVVSYESLAPLLQFPLMQRLCHDDASAFLSVSTLMCPERNSLCSHTAASNMLNIRPSHDITEGIRGERVHSDPNLELSNGSHQGSIVGLNNPQNRGPRQVADRRTHTPTGGKHDDNNTSFGHLLFNKPLSGQNVTTRGSGLPFPSETLGLYRNSVACTRGSRVCLRK